MRLDGIMGREDTDVILIPGRNVVSDRCDDYIIITYFNILILLQLIVQYLVCDRFYFKFYFCHYSVHYFMFFFLVRYIDLHLMF